MTNGKTPLFLVKVGVFTEKIRDNPAKAPKHTRIFADFRKFNVNCY